MTKYEYNCLNNIPWGTIGEQKSIEWLGDYLTPASQFYAKWSDVKDQFTFEMIKLIHERLFGIDITIWNDPETVFVQLALIQLYCTGNLGKHEIPILYKDIYRRLGHAIEGHETIWETLGTNIELLVLGAIVLEQYPSLISTYKEMFRKDRYILAIMNKELTVPVQLDYPDMEITGQKKETFEFLVKLTEM